MGEIACVPHVQWNIGLTVIQKTDPRLLVVFVMADTAKQGFPFFHAHPRHPAPMTRTATPGRGPTDVVAADDTPPSAHTAMPLKTAGEEAVAEGENAALRRALELLDPTVASPVVTSRPLPSLPPPPPLLPEVPKRQPRPAVAPPPLYGGGGSPGDLARVHDEILRKFQDPAAHRSQQAAVERDRLRGFAPATDAATTTTRGVDQRFVTTRDGTVFPAVDRHWVPAWAHHLPDYLAVDGLPDGLPEQHASGDPSSDAAWHSFHRRRHATLVVLEELLLKLLQLPHPRFWSCVTRAPRVIAALDAFLEARATTHMASMQWSEVLSAAQRPAAQATGTVVTPPAEESPACKAAEHFLQLLRHPIEASLLQRVYLVWVRILRYRESDTDTFSSASVHAALLWDANLITMSRLLDLCLIYADTPADAASPPAARLTNHPVTDKRVGFTQGPPLVYNHAMPRSTSFSGKQARASARDELRKALRSFLQATDLQTIKAAAAEFGETQASLHQLLRESHSGIRHVNAKWAALTSLCSGPYGDKAPLEVEMPESAPVTGVDDASLQEDIKAFKQLLSLLFDLIYSLKAFLAMCPPVVVHLAPALTCHLLVELYDTTLPTLRDLAERWTWTLLIRDLAKRRPSRQNTPLASPMLPRTAATQPLTPRPMLPRTAATQPLTPQREAYLKLVGRCRRRMAPWTGRLLLLKENTLALFHLIHQVAYHAPSNVLTTDESVELGIVTSRYVSQPSYGILTSIED